MVAEQRNVLLSTLLALETGAVCTEIAAVLWEQAQEAARSVRAMSGAERAKAMTRLQRSPSLVDRHTLRLLALWDADDKERGW